MSANHEFTFVGDLIFPTLSPSEMRECAKMEGVRREYFHDPDCRAAFDALMDSATVDDAAVLAKIAAAFKDKREKLERCHGSASINETLACANVRSFAEDERKRHFNEGAGKLLGDLANNRISRADFMLKIEALDGETTARHDDDDDGMTPDELGPQMPEEEDPDVLFRNDWLSRGNGAVLVAETGKGKSVLSLQMAYCWAFGKPAFGIEPLRPLKIAVFQTEDNDREMRQFRDNIKRGLKELHGWTDEELKKANGNIKLFGTKGLLGDAFIDRLRQKIFRKDFDLVILNPLQGVFGGELNQNSELSSFLREKLDRTIQSRFSKCGVLIVHHTNKPPLDPRQKRLDAYIGAGGAELANWMRAMLVLDEQKDGSFLLAAPKRGQRLNWQTHPKLHRPAVEIRQAPHDTGLIFWLDDAAAAKLGTVKAEAPEMTFDEKAIRFADALKEKAYAGEPCAKTKARTLAQQVVENAREGNMVYKHMMDNLDNYGLEAKKTGNSTEVVIVPKGS